MALPRRSAMDVATGKTTHEEDLQYIQEAIAAGDTLMNKDTRSSAARRALIVAPTYQNDPNPERGRMSETIRDARLVHQLLVGKYEYEAADIRILSDGFRVGDLGHHAYSTRQNILDSLEWLVDDAKAGDRRFFHFSGHGQIRETEQGEGKLARVLPELFMVDKGDTEKNIAYLKKRVGRTTSMTTKNTGVAYYTEAIVTTVDVGTQDNQQCVTDQELNKVFSKLPPGCHLTCLLDCCHSGRMIDNAIKLAGSGFRGSAPPQVAQDDKMLSNLINTTIALQETVSSAANADTPADDDETSDVTYDEKLPEEEQTRDTIQAQTLTWAAAHQRQFAGMHFSRRCGLLTAFFATILERRPEITVEELHKLVEYSVLVVSKKQKYNLQYVQLRMSPKTANETEQRNIMKGKVEI